MKVLPVFLSVELNSECFGMKNECLENIPLWWLLGEFPLWTICLWIFSWRIVFVLGYILIYVISYFLTTWLPEKTWVKLRKMRRYNCIFHLTQGCATNYLWRDRNCNIQRNIFSVSDHEEFMRWRRASKVEDMTKNGAGLVGTAQWNFFPVHSFHLETFRV